MRLINTATLKLSEFFEIDRPKFAILSHTWEQDEVSYLEMAVSPIGAQTAAKAGFRKIQRFADLARTDGWKWIWVDTCCIDKTSSADLSESINSMYRWYGDAAVCYVYLSDLEGPQSPPEALSQCRWTTRGWTLQELIAPVEVRFCSQAWEFCFTRAERCSQLRQITGIDQRVLQRQVDPLTCSAAQRMSWASNRQTTRAEDMAYCLLGLFGITMPMLYGEGGQRAFIRLQEEILKGPFDESLFAWTDRDSTLSTYRGLLSRHPREFEFSGNLRASFNSSTSRSESRIGKVSTSNLGLKVNFYRFDAKNKPGASLAVLRCSASEDSETKSWGNDIHNEVCIMLKEVDEEPAICVRTNANELYRSNDYQDADVVDSGGNERFYMPVNTVSHIHLPDDHQPDHLGGFFPIEVFKFNSPWKRATYCSSDSSLEWDSQRHGWIVSESRTGWRDPAARVTHMAIKYDASQNNDNEVPIMVIVSWDRRPYGERASVGFDLLRAYGYIVNVVAGQDVPDDYGAILEYLKSSYNIKRDFCWRPTPRKWLSETLDVLVSTRMFGDQVGVAVEITGKFGWGKPKEGQDKTNNTTA